MTDDDLAGLVWVCQRPARAVDGVSTEDRLKALLEAAAGPAECTETNVRQNCGLNLPEHL